MRQERSQTKVIATIGPASSSKEVLEEMFHEGIDVCRLNFSHGTHEQHLEVINTIRELNKELISNVAILGDLQGPKLRVGDIKGGKIDLVAGSCLIFTSIPCEGTMEEVYVSYADFAKDVEIGNQILIDDGKLLLEVVETNKKDKVKAKVLQGGVLSSRKGVNLPDTKLSMPSLTEKDLEDAKFALEQDVDWLALSFVRSAKDVIDLKRLVADYGRETRVIAKIEKPEAINDLKHIIDEANAVMIARGDLGVEVSFDRVPLIQKNIIQKCIDKAKPVIIATQMMESMIDNFRPTRAEANDVANAVLDGADTLMLSGETSVGKYPVGVVKSMQKVIDWTERQGFDIIRKNVPSYDSYDSLPDAICRQASNLANQIDAKAIITFTYSGYTAFRISSFRPNANIFAFTSNTDILRALSLVWGVRAQFVDLDEGIDAAINFSLEILMAKGWLKKGDKVVHVGSTPINKKGETNLLKVSMV